MSIKWWKIISDQLDLRSITILHSSSRYQQLSESISDDREASIITNKRSILEDVQIKVY